MSWWTDLRDTVETVATGGLNLPFNDSARNKVEGAVNSILGRTNASDKRTQASMVSDQIQAYKDQTALSQQQLADTQSQRDVVKRQINEKQIRALRGQYGTNRGGFLNVNNSNPPNSLGGGNLSSKLGT